MLTWRTHKGGMRIRYMHLVPLLILLSLILALYMLILKVGRLHVATLVRIGLGGHVLATHLRILSHIGHEHLPLGIHVRLRRCWEGESPGEVVHLVVHRHRVLHLLL